MNNKLPQQNTEDDVDLGQLFNAIGNLFNKLFNFIISLCKGAFNLIILLLKPIVNNIKIVGAVLFICAIVGFIADKLKDPVYKSNMLVKPHFNSKYQLINNVDYFNSLIGSKDLKTLSEIFEIDTLAAKNLKGFDIKIGPESKAELLEQYNDYVKTVDTYVKNKETDSVRAAYFTYKEFIDNRDELDADIYDVSAKSLDKAIFSKLEKGFIKIFENDYSKKLKEKADKTYAVNKASYLKQLDRVDSLQQVYVEVLKNDSKNNNLSFGGNTLMPLAKEKTGTKEYELFQEEIRIRYNLKYIEEEFIEDEDYYDIVAPFGKIGTPEKDTLNRYLFLFPLLGMLLLITIFVSFKIFLFIKNFK